MDAPLFTTTPEQMEPRVLRRSGNTVGGFLVAIVAMQTLLRVLQSIGALSFLSRFAVSHEAELLLNMLLYLMMLAVPAWGVAALTRAQHPHPFRAQPISGDRVLIALFVGLFFAIFSNVLANWMANWFSMFGIPIPEFSDTIQPTWSSLLLNLLATAVLPALIEEMVFRGYILQALRRHGDGIAIVLSALLFGLLHGNVLQIPFAFVLGLAMGYLCVQTENFWIPVLVHFANNAMSVIIGFCGVCDPSLKMAVSNMVLVAVAAVGMIAVVVVCLRRGYWRTIGNGVSSLSVAGRVQRLLCSPLMVLALLLMVLALGGNM